MLLEFKVTNFQTNEFVYQEFVKANKDDIFDKGLDHFELMKRSLKTAINGVKAKREHDGKDFHVHVRNIIENKHIKTFNFMKVYSGEINNG